MFKNGFATPTKEREMTATQAVTIPSPEDREPKTEKLTVRASKELIEAVVTGTYQIGGRTFTVTTNPETRGVILTGTRGAEYGLMKNAHRKNLFGLVNLSLRNSTPFDWVYIGQDGKVTAIR